MGGFIDLRGRTFDKLSPIYFIPGGKGHGVSWFCQCSCGGSIIKKAHDLKRLKENHCGCELLVNKKTKVCSICKIEKPRSEYHNLKAKVGGIQSKCKSCTKKITDERYKKNGAHIRALAKKCQDKPESKQKNREYYIKNKEQYKERYLEYMKDAKKKVAKAATSKKYNSEKQDKIRERVIEYNKKPHVKLRKKEVHQQRKETDIEYNIKRRLRSRLRKIVVELGNGKFKYKSSMELLGCDLVFLKSHLEKSFTENMSWDVLHLLDIDHIKPCARFTLSDLEEQKKCFHWSNLQFLWKRDNQIKNAKYNLE